MKRLMAAVVGLALCVASGSVARADATAGALGGYATQEFTVPYSAGYDAGVVLESTGRTCMIVEVYDGLGNLVARDSDQYGPAVVSFVPLWAQTFTIKVINPSPLPNEFYLGTK